MALSEDDADDLFDCVVVVTVDADVVELVWEVLDVVLFKVVASEITGSERD